MQLKRFLTLFSVLPGSYLTISDQRLPIFFRSYKIWRSSSVENGSLLISGLRKLYHLSLHCFPLRVTLFQLPSYAWSTSFSFSAISCHCFVPLTDIILNSSSSSLFCHCVFVIVLLWPWFHLYWHWASFLPGTNFATFCQSLEVKLGGFICLLVL